MSNKSRRNTRGGQPAKHQPGAAARPTRTVVAPAASDRRRQLERASAPLLIKLHDLPRWLVPVTVSMLLFVGLVLQGGIPGIVGGLMILVVAVFVGWLTALSWPILQPLSKVIRVLVVAAMFGLVILKVTGRF